MNTLGGDGSVVETDKDVKDFLFGSLDIPLVNLETSLKNYVSNLEISYQTLCEKHPSFRERSENVDLVVEISLQPWKVFKPDGVRR